jgi:hypothetical protein
LECSPRFQPVAERRRPKHLQTCSNPRQSELILGQGASATVRASSPVTLWVVPAEDLKALAAKRPDLLLEVRL